jgi:hypothetical protein
MTCRDPVALVVAAFADLITSCQSTHAWRSMRSFVTSVPRPGLRSNPDPVRFCAQYASSARHLFIRFDSLRSAITNIPQLYSINGRRLMQSFPFSTAAATAFTTTANNTLSNPPLTTTPCGRWTCSQRGGEGALPRVLRSF